MLLNRFKYKSMVWIDSKIAILHAAHYLPRCMVKARKIGLKHGSLKKATKISQFFCFFFLTFWQQKSLSLIFKLNIYVLSITNKKCLHDSNGNKRTNVTCDIVILTVYVNSNGWMRFGEHQYTHFKSKCHSTGWFLAAISYRPVVIRAPITYLLYTFYIFFIVVVVVFFFSCILSAQN